MEWTIGHFIVIALIILGLAAMLTGNDGALLERIIDWLIGLGLGGTAAAIEYKRATSK